MATKTTTKRGRMILPQNHQKAQPQFDAQPKPKSPFTFATFHGQVHFLVRQGVWRPFRICPPEATAAYLHSTRNGD